MAFTLPNIAAEPRSDEQKVMEILKIFKEKFPRFSLRKFLEVLFSSDNGTITNTTSVFLRDGGALAVMDLWWEKSNHLPEMQLWPVRKGALVCRKEVSWLAERARDGAHFEDAKALRISPDKVTVQLMQSFRLKDLRLRYEHGFTHSRCDRWLEFSLLGCSGRV
jgi:hypothetical protein